MGNSGSSAIHLHPTRNSSSSGKENRPKRFSKYASPENRVLPPPIVGQKLRITDNGNILHNGGTISGRKVHVFQQRIEADEEFLEILNRRSQLSDDIPQETKASHLYGHRKTQSDPDIARTLRELDASMENDQDDDDSTHHPRSIIAVGASKAKIKSRKKGRAPEPPANGILSKEFGQRPSSPSSERGRRSPLGKYQMMQESAEFKSPQSQPDPNINIPTPPPPPPPDYFSANKTSDSRSWFNNAPGSSTYEKNRGPPQKWKQNRPNADVNSELLSRIRARSMENINSICDPCPSDSKRNCVFNGKQKQSEPQMGNSNKSNRILSTMRQDARSTELFKEEIIAAAKRRASGLFVSTSKERPKSAHSNNSDKNSTTNHSSQDGAPGRHNDTFEKQPDSKSPKTYFFMGTVKKSSHNPNSEPIVPKDIRISSSALSSSFAQKQLATNAENASATNSGPTKAVISHTFGSSDKPVSTQKVIDLPGHPEDQAQCSKIPQTVSRQNAPSQSSKHSSKCSSANQDLVQRNSAEFRHYSENPYSLLCGAPGDQEIQKSSEKVMPQYTKNVTRRTNTGNSSSSAESEDEDVEIDIQLRPTLPKRQFDVARFSPTEAWKMLAVEREYNCPSEESSDEGETAYEDMIRMISRPVAPRRNIAIDRCGDSGISPDAGSPALMANENLLTGDQKMHVLQDKIQRSAMVERDDLDRTSRGGWTPLQDLDDSDVCSVDHDTPTSPVNKQNPFNAQTKFALPYTMFVSRSLQRNHNDVPVKRQGGAGNYRQRRSQNIHEMPQQSHGFKNLKKALGLKLKTIPLETPHIDSNWSLSRSIPHSLHKLGSNSEVIKERSKSVCHLHEDDEMEGNNSRSLSSPALQNGHCAEDEDDEGNDEGDVYDNEDNEFWSLPYRPSSNHVMYLPQHGRRPNMAKESTHEQKYKAENLGRNLNQPAKQKRFTYQSTVRREQRKQIAEKLSQEAASREMQRQREIEWMNRVEEEFRRQREKEKRNIREQLLMLNRGGHNQGFNTTEPENERSKNNRTENGATSSDRKTYPKTLENSQENDLSSPLPQYGKPPLAAAATAQDTHPRSQIGQDPWCQPSGMSKWLRRQRKVDHNMSTSPRPEPEGGRSSGDEGKLLVETRMANMETENTSKGSGEGNIPHKYKQASKDEIPEFADRTPSFIEYNGTSSPPPFKDYNSFSYMGDPSSSSGFGSKGDSSPNTSPNDTFSSSENILLEDTERSKYFRASRPPHRSGNKLAYQSHGLHYENGYNHDPRIVEAHLKANGETSYQKTPASYGYTDHPAARTSQQKQKRYWDMIHNFRRKPKHYTDDSDSYSDEIPYFSTPSPTSNGKVSRDEPFLRQNSTTEDEICDLRSASKRFSRNHPYRNGGRMKSQSPTTPSYLPLHKPGLPKPFNPKTEYRPVPFHSVVSPTMHNHNSQMELEASRQKNVSYDAR